MLLDAFSMCGSPQQPGKFDRALSMASLCWGCPDKEGCRTRKRSHLFGLLLVLILFGVIIIFGVGLLLLSVLGLLGLVLFLFLLLLRLIEVLPLPHEGVRFRDVVGDDNVVAH